MIKKAKWIWSNNDEMVNQYVDFFREFELEKLDNDAFIEIECAFFQQFLKIAEFQSVACGIVGIVIVFLFFGDDGGDIRFLSG